MRWVVIPGGGEKKELFVAGCELLVKAGSVGRWFLASSGGIVYAGGLFWADKNVYPTG